MLFQLRKMLHEPTIACSQDSLLRRCRSWVENGIAVLWESLLFDVYFPTSIFLFVGSQRQDHPLNVFVELRGHGDEDRRLLNAPVEKEVCGAPWCTDPKCSKCLPGATTLRVVTKHCLTFTECIALLVQVTREKGTKHDAPVAISSGL